MIADLVKGSGFTGALRYDQEKEGARVISTNLSSTGPEDQGREFRAAIPAKSRCEKPVWHCSVAAPPGDRKMSDEEWAQIGREHMKSMGFTDRHLYVITRHTDKDHDHIHIVASRVDPETGKALSDGKDYYKQSESMRSIEKAHGLTVVPERNPLDPDKYKSSEQGEYAALRQDIDKAIAESRGDRGRFDAALQSRGIEPRYNTSKTTGHVSGMSYAHEGGIVKGSDLGKGYSYIGTEKRLAGEQTRSQGKAPGHAQAPANGLKLPSGLSGSDAKPNPRQDDAERTQRDVERQVQRGMRELASIAKAIQPAATPKKSHELEM